MRNALFVAEMLILVGVASGGETNADLVVGKWREIGSTKTMEFFKEGTVILVDDDGEQIVGDYRRLDGTRIRIDFGGLGQLVGAVIAAVDPSASEIIFTNPVSERLEVYRKGTRLGEEEKALDRSKRSEVKSPGKEAGLLGRYLGKVDGRWPVFVELRSDGTAVMSYSQIFCWEVIWNPRDDPPYSPTLMLMFSQLTGESIGRDYHASDGKKATKIPLDFDSHRVDYWHRRVMDSQELLVRKPRADSINLGKVRVWDRDKSTACPGEVRIWNRYVNNVGDRESILELESIPNFRPAGCRRTIGYDGSAVFYSTCNWETSGNAIRILVGGNIQRELEVQGDTLMDKKHGIAFIKQSGNFEFLTFATELLRSSTLPQGERDALPTATHESGTKLSAETILDPNVTTHGSIEVTARLEEIRGDLIEHPLYDYAHVMKYKVLQVHRGRTDKDVIYVGHYDPTEPRSSVADARVQQIGGNVKQFRVGDVHRMAMEVPIDDHYKGGIINKYFGEVNDPVYWAIWTDQAVKVGEGSNDNSDKSQTTREGFKALDIKLPRPMFVGTPADSRIANLERPLGKPRPPFFAPLGTSNVALQKPVRSAEGGAIIGSLRMITDGDKEARDGSYVEMGPSNQYVTIDLEKQAELYAIVVWHYHKQPRVYYDVVVQLSNAPSFIKDVKTVFNNDFDNSAGLGVGKDMHYVETCEGKLIDCLSQGSPKARYVRLYSNGNTSNDLNHYIEVEVYGKPIPMDVSAGAETLGEMILNVPFITQVPPGTVMNGKWPKTRNCGQTSCLMVFSYFNKTKPTDNDIKKIDDWLYERFGEEQTVNDYDGSFTDRRTLQLLCREYGGFPASHTENGWSLPKIRYQIDKGNPVVVAVAGKLDGKYFTYDGWQTLQKDYSQNGHWLVVTGYSGSDMVCNDPGTTRGHNVRYSDRSFRSAMLAWADPDWKGAVVVVQAEGTTAGEDNQRPLLKAIE